MSRITKRMKMGADNANGPPSGPFPYPKGTMNEQHVDIDKGGIHILIKEYGVVNRTACQHCIGGHRVKGCKHIFRVLRNAKRAGRPLTHCDHTVECGEVCTEDAAFVCIDPPEYYELSSGLPVRIAQYMGQMPKQQKGAHKSSKSTGNAKLQKEKSQSSAKESPPSTVASVSPRTKASPGRQRLPLKADICLPLAPSSGSSCVSDGCQCGPTCACIGCKLHGNNVPSTEAANPCACQTCQCYSEVVVHATAAPELDHRRQLQPTASEPSGCCSSKKSSHPKTHSSRHSHSQREDVDHHHGHGGPARLENIDTSHNTQFHYPPQDLANHHNIYNNSVLGMNLSQYNLNLDPMADTLHNSQPSNVAFPFSSQYIHTPSTTMTPSFLPHESLTDGDFGYTSPYDIVEPDMSIFDTHFGQYHEDILPSFSEFQDSVNQPLEETVQAEHHGVRNEHALPSLKQETDIEPHQPRSSAGSGHSCCGGGSAGRGGH